MDFVLVLLISGTVFGLIGVAIAKSKGVEPQAGLLLGGFLGPIGLIILALLNPKPGRPVVTGEFAGDRDLSSDRYRLWLSNKYSISKNDVLSLYSIGSDTFKDLEAALTHADNLEGRAVVNAQARLNRVRRSAPYVIAAIFALFGALWFVAQAQNRADRARYEAYDNEISGSNPEVGRAEALASQAALEATLGASAALPPLTPSTTTAEAVARLDASLRGWLVGSWAVNGVCEGDAGETFVANGDWGEWGVDGVWQLNRGHLTVTRQRLTQDTASGEPEQISPPIITTGTIRNVSADTFELVIGDEVRRMVRCAA